ncbi:N-carbamoyl-D-amino acid hydrolase, putative [hydrothermal vent metagenome]|uniref:N-carbamoyl-D-amino acid hydrolase, putative n=1 Tax=hydrothermal vent metagenome TaxID=652676 RepID=A0A3B0T0A7_9ZZZZ
MRRAELSRKITVGAAQMGPIARTETRSEVVVRLIALLDEGASRGCDLIVFPELTLTTFFPRWFLDDEAAIDRWYEAEMPGPETQALFDRAREVGVGFCLGYAELHYDDDGTKHRYNTQILVERDGSVVGKYRKLHVPGHEHNEPDRPFQHLERYYFEPGPDGYQVWNAFEGVVGMAICNDRRWSETYRVMGLQGVELILIGYNTPLHYSPDPQQNALAGFHNHLVMQSGAYQNGTYVVGVAKGGIEEGVDSLAQSVIIAPSGQIKAQCITTGDEIAIATIDLDYCDFYKNTLFDFDRYHQSQHFGLISKPHERRVL